MIQRNRRALLAAVDSLGPDRPESLGIVGAGMMGTAIAAAAAGHGLPVVLSDCDAEVLANAPRAVTAELGDDAGSVVERLVRTTTDLSEVARCDVVLESVAENVPVKRAVYAGVEPCLAERTVLGTNTSTIPIARLATELTTPGRFCGIHCFHPVRERPLVEIVRGPETDERTIAVGMALADALGKMAVVVEDGPGFLVNRLLHGPSEAMRRAAAPVDRPMVSARLAELLEARPT